MKVLFFLVKILIELCYFCDYFSRVLESAKMYLQFYINENGDKVYTTKVRHFCKSQWLFCHKLTCMQTFYYFRVEATRSSVLQLSICDGRFVFEPLIYAIFFVGLCNLDPLYLHYD